MTGLHWPEASMLRVPQGAGPPWAASITTDELVGVWHAVVPLRRMLLLLGHDVAGVYYRHSDSGFEWVHIDATFDGTGVDDATVVDDADLPGGPRRDGHAWDGPTIALPLTPILDARDGNPMAVPPVGPADGDPPLDGGASWAVEPDGAYLYAGCDDDPAVEPDSVLGDRMYRLGVALDACVAAQAGLLADGMLAAPLGPDSGCGLTWLLDPQFWRPDAESGLRWPSAPARKVEALGATARDALLALQPALPSALAEQVAEDPSPIAPTAVDVVSRRSLVDLLRMVSEWYYGAPEDAATFFTALGTWLKEREQEALLPPQRVEELAGMSWFGVLVSLVEAGVLTPSALGAVAPAPPPDPVVEQRISRWAVELTVLQHWVVVLRRVRDDDGVVLVDEEPDQGDASLLDPIPEFTWDYVVPDDDAELPTLFLVAAPGVQIDLPVDPPDGWRYEVIRVMDRSLVPPWGSAVDPVPLLAPYLLYPGDAVDSTFTIVFPGDEPPPPTSVAGPPGDVVEQPPAAPAVQVTPLPRGMRLHYPVYQDGSGEAVLAVEVSLPGSAYLSGDERYAFDVAFYLETLPRDTPLPYVSVWATAGVHVAVRNVLFSWDLLSPVDILLPAGVWRVGDYADVPTLGEPLPIDERTVPRWREWVPEWDPGTAGDGRLPAERGFTLLDVDELELPFWFTFAVDLVVGFVPVVGDLADLYELCSMVALGRDRWNRPVTNFDIVLQGFFTIMPFASGAAARGMGRTVIGLVTAAGRAGLLAGAGPATLVQLAVRQVDDAGKALTREAVDAELAPVAAGWKRMSARSRRLAATQVAAFVEEWVGRFGTTLPGQFFTLDDLLHPNAAGFRIQEVQQAFTRWRARLDPAEVAARTDLELIEQFVELGVRGRARVILKALLGDAVVGAGVRKARLHPKMLARWPSLAGIVFRKIPIPQEDLLARLDAVVDEVGALVAARHGDDAAHGAPQWVDCTYLDYSPAAAGSADVYVARVRRLLAVLGDGNPDAVDLKALRRILGNKSYHPRELAAVLVAGIDALGHEAARHGRSIDDFLPPEGAARIPIRGIESFFQKVCTGSSPEHAARLEVGMVANALNEGTAADDLVMGIMLPGAKETDSALRQGPDLGRFSRSRARLEQGKSYTNADILLGDAPPPTQWLGPGGEWKGPEVFRQLWSDLVRLDKVGHRLTHPRTGRAVRVHGEIVFRLHGQWYYANKIGPRMDLDDEIHFLEEELIQGFQEQVNAFLSSPAALAELPNLPAGLVYKVSVKVLP